MSIREYHEAKRDSRPHWYGEVSSSPIDDVLTNLTAQGAWVREVGIHAAADVLKRHGLRPGQVFTVSAADKKAAQVGENNPYANNFRGTEEQRQARIASLIKSGGTKLATSLAASAGKTITGAPLRRPIKR